MHFFIIFVGTNIKIIKMSSTLDKSVYVAQCKDLGLTKIGISVNPPKRVASLQSTIGAKVEICEWTQILENAREIEAFIKEYFKEFTYDGEWFSLDPRELLYVLPKLPFVISDVVHLFNIGKSPSEISYIIEEGKRVCKYSLSEILKIEQAIQTGHTITNEDKNKYKTKLNQFRLSIEKTESVMRQYPKYPHHKHPTYKVFSDNMVFEYGYRYFRWLNKNEWENGEATVDDYKLLVDGLPTN